MNNIICSGYFAPLHNGHISYLNEASKLGRLFVIVNSDYQTALKGSVPFMSEKERLLIIKNLKCVSNALISIDKDSSVTESIRYIHEVYNNIDTNDTWIFANGGDRNMWTASPQEKEACDQLNIKYIYACGGDTKYNSSSNLIKEVSKRWLETNYGFIPEYIIHKFLRRRYYSQLSLETRNELNRILHDK